MSGPNNAIISSPDRRFDPVTASWPRAARRLALLTGTIVASAGALSLSLATGAHAQSAPAQSASGPDASSDGLQEIVVTAQKRSSTVQATPASISAVTGVGLQERGITSLATLAQATPGVSLKSEGPSQTEIEMRGMTSSGGNSPTVGFYLDDVPLTGPAGAQNGHVIIDPSLYDLDRVEILRGPQGTLYGASSMGGTVKLITNQADPNVFAGSAQTILSGTDGGGFNHNDNFMLNIPVVESKLALRVVGTENFTSGWINRIVAYPFPLVNYNPATTIATRGNVQNAPVQAEYPGSNAYRIYGARVSALWLPTDNLTVKSSFFYEASRQNGVSAFDSTPGVKNAHYEPFDISEPLTDKIAVGALTVDYSFDDFDVTSSTGLWYRKSTQIEEASEEFNNPDSAATYASNNGLPNPGYYGPTGSGPESGVERDPSRQFSEELRFTSKGDGPFTWVAGAYYSYFWSRWTFAGTTPNYGTYMDLGTFAPATTPNWFDADEPSSTSQHALFGDLTYALTDQLKADIGLRWSNYDYKFSACISGWGSGLGAAQPSCSGLIKLNQYQVNPKFNLTYTYDPDLMMYATVSNGSRPGGGDAVYPTTGAIWGPAFAAYNYTSGKWPSTYQSDRVWSYEIGQKARFLDHRLTVDTSVYYEDWENIQLEAYPNVWALNINGKKATILGGDINTIAVLGGGFDLTAGIGYLYEKLESGPYWQIQPNNVLPDVARINGDLVLAYAKDLSEKYTFKAQVEYSYTGSRYSLAFGNGFETNGQYIKLPGYSLANIRVGLESDDGWEAALFINNATNTHAQLENLFQLNEASSAFNRVVTNQPLTGGIDLKYHF
jgi:outer membrane receptor protein involved in Fe transport